MSKFFLPRLLHAEQISNHKFATFGKFISYNTIGETMKMFYLQEELADVYFTFISDGQRIPAHKVVLAAKSERFKAMFSKPLSNGNELEIHDFSAAAFKEFLQFFYLDSITLTRENLLEVLSLGKKYNMFECLECAARLLNDSLTLKNVLETYQLAVSYDFPRLEMKCQWFLHQSIKAENVVWVYKVATFFNLQPLMEECERKIGFWAQDLLKSTSLLKCDRHIFKSIVNLDFLDCSECELFNAIMNWIKASTNGQNVTEELIKCKYSDLIECVRFEAIPSHNFKQLKNLYGSLIPIELNDLNESCVERFDAIPNDIPSMWDKNAEITCYRKMNYLPPNRSLVNSEESTIFWSRKPFLLNGFSFDYRLYDSTETNCYNNSIWSGCHYNYTSSNWGAWNVHTLDKPTNGEKDKNVKITVIRASKDLWSSKLSNEKILHTSSVTVAGDKEMVVTFPKTLLIQPKFIYIIRLQQSDKVFTSYKTKMETVVKVKPDFDIIFHFEKSEVINSLFINAI